MTVADLQAAIERSEAKCQELQAGQARAINPTVSFPAILPDAGRKLREMIAGGIAGDVKEALNARVVLRELFCGRIDLLPAGGGDLWAQFGFEQAGLAQAVVGNRVSGRPLLCLSWALGV